jgi:hypothetical protein
MENGEVLLCLGGLLLKLYISNSKGGFKESMQFSNAVSQPIILIVGHDALLDHGLLPVEFPNQVYKIKPGNRGFILLSLLSSLESGKRHNSLVSWVPNLQKCLGHTAPRMTVSFLVL